MVSKTDKHYSDNASDSGSDSEDDDFVPEAIGGPSSLAASTSKATRKKATNNTDDGSDAESDDDLSGDEGASAALGEEIDNDELEALKRERAELVTAAGGEDRLGKRRRLAQDSSTTSAGSTVAADEEAEALNAKALAEWEAIKGSDSTPAPTSQESQAGTSTTSLAPEEMISIPTTYKFAGEIHTSFRLLPRSHPEAVKYLSQTNPASTPSSSTATTTAPTSITTTSTSTNSNTDPPTKRPPPPGPRRKKTSSLAALSAAATTTKPTKLNTLEKSKLDWDTFKGNSAKLSQQELDELENQTKGGGKGLGDMKGYLERRDFLDRVKDRTGKP
ncbi:related to SWR1-complex protein 5 [Ustilago trichophora]|uniref:SWR1-complex protein 5 n=1 Tax=Ustilago trichophora TaxID=86804 RepID=A0A5C3EGS9_9BASI|nr:related to SWR1-complex protein 5 [Ustilago trichophora]